MKEDFYFLKEKADKFMEMADVAIKKKHYDLAALNLEQAIQLYLKFTIGITIGNFPHTHNLDKLLKLLSETYPDCGINELVKKKKDVMNDLYKSYFDSRYFDKPFTANQIRKMKQFILDLKKILEKLWTL
jgi:HEPN domain-containing protein